MSCNNMVGMDKFSPGDISATSFFQTLNSNPSGNPLGLNFGCPPIRLLNFKFSLVLSLL